MIPEEADNNNRAVCHNVPRIRLGGDAPCTTVSVMLLWLLRRPRR